MLSTSTNIEVQWHILQLSCRCYGVDFNLPISRCKTQWQKIVQTNTYSGKYLIKTTKTYVRFSPETEKHRMCNDISKGFIFSMRITNECQW